MLLDHLPRDKTLCSIKSTAAGVLAVGRSVGLPSCASITQSSSSTVASPAWSALPAGDNRSWSLCLLNRESIVCAHTRHASITVGLLTLQRAAVRPFEPICATDTVARLLMLRCRACWMLRRSSCRLTIVDLYATVAFCYSLSL